MLFANRMSARNGLACLLALLLLTTSSSYAADSAPPAWIWAGETGEDQTIVLRRTFEIGEQAIDRTRLTLACDNSAEVFVNGRQVLKHGSWRQVVFKDVASQLAAGRNVIAVRARNTGGPAGVLLQLEADAGGRRSIVVSDSLWKVSTSPADGWPQPEFDDSRWSDATVVATLGEGSWSETDAEKLATAAEIREPVATPVSQIKAAKGFDVELLYSVPKDEQGSWVNMCTDPQGRLIVSDQSGGLYRVTPAPAGSGGRIEVEHLPVDIGEAQGLLWAFDSLYVVVNRGGNYESGLYRVTDTDGDGELDTVNLLLKLEGRGEHGPHAVLLSPDKQSLTIVCGDSTKLPELDSSRVPRVWDEDFLIPRLYGRGFMKGVPAPGGFIAKTDPDGKNWELIATGFRNQFDAAYNRDGELFTFDADMEWDINTPWYRPTRVNHVVSGAEFGWRNGSGKWPAHYFDSLPAAVDIGPGSPTGVCFGYGADFPQKYQDALFLCDWSYGKLYAAHLRPEGATYGGTFEEFLNGTPLPLTDVVINPLDGQMYFTIGGRGVQSGLYRVTYTGGEDSQAAAADSSSTSLAQSVTQRALRHELEALHRPADGAVDHAWPKLGSNDRFIRYAARIAIEHQPVEQWRDRALSETEPRPALAALLALVRQQPRAEALRNDVHDPVLPDYATSLDLSDVDAELKGQVLAALDRLEWRTLSNADRADLLRVYTVLLARMGPPGEQGRQHLIEKFDEIFPTAQPRLDAEILRLLVELQSPNAAAAAVELLTKAPSQEEQIDYAMSLRFLRAGWTDELLQAYLGWFPKALGYRGGANFTMFIDELKQDAVALLSEEQATKFADIINQAPRAEQLVTVGPPRETVREWTLGELEALLSSGLHDRNFDRGREMFGVAKCFACHRFSNEGGALGPDLTALAGRFSRRDLLESIVNPDKVISDQYAAVQIVTTDGRVVVGRIVNLGGDSFSVNTDMLDPNAQVSVDRKFIDEMQHSPVSMMPKGLLNTLHADEILDLMAYLLSRGDPSSSLFAEAGGANTTLAVAGAGDAAPSSDGQPPAGFRALFNGEDLSGWHGMPHFDPRKLAGMEPEAKQAQIDEWTADAEQHWTVDNGELVNDGHGAYLTTDEEFGDYELLIEYKTVPLADSGIYLKSTPQVQIWDYRKEGGKWDRGADKGSGGLWNNTEDKRRQVSQRARRQAAWRVEFVPYSAGWRADECLAQRSAGRRSRNPGKLLGPRNAAVRQGTDPVADPRRRDPLAEHFHP